MTDDEVRRELQQLEQAMQNRTIVTRVILSPVYGADRDLPIAWRPTDRIVRISQPSRYQPPPKEQK